VIHTCHNLHVFCARAHRVESKASVKVKRKYLLLICLSPTDKRRQSWTVMLIPCFLFRCYSTCNRKRSQQKNWLKSITRRGRFRRQKHLLHFISCFQLCKGLQQLPKNVRYHFYRTWTIMTLQDWFTKEWALRLLCSHRASPVKNRHSIIKLLQCLSKNNNFNWLIDW